MAELSDDIMESINKDVDLAVQLRKTLKERKKYLIEFCRKCKRENGTSQERCECKVQRLLDNIVEALTE